MKRHAQYIKRSLTDFSKSQVIGMANEMGITKNIVDDLHLTLVYTKTPMKMPVLDNELLFLSSGYTVENWKTKDGYDILVLVLQDIRPLLERVDYFKSLGATSDFPEFKAHITLTYDKPIGFSESGHLDKPRFMTFGFSEEVYKDVYESWEPTLTEEKL